MFRNVLVTGGAGYIGAHVCKALKAHGMVPIVFDSLITGSIESVRYGPFEKGDIRDKSALEKVFATYQIDAVIHMAASIEVGKSVQDPLPFYDNNIAGTISLLYAFDKAGCNTVIFSSSAAVYGNPNAVPIKEDASLAPINPYGYTKFFVEKVLSQLSKERGIRSCALRYFNACGADPDGEIGPRNPNPSHVIPRFLKKVLSGEEITVYGDSYQTKDGSCVRDYVHVSDIAEAHVLALKKLGGSEGAHVYNLGSETGVSVLELLHSIEEVTGKKCHYTIGNLREGDPACLVASSEKAQRELGWKAQHSSIRKILETAWHWEKNCL